jgi:hypothetical protein
MQNLEDRGVTTGSPLVASRPVLTSASAETTDSTEREPCLCLDQIVKDRALSSR